MEFRKIASMRVDGPATGGTVTEYRLPARAGGRFVKQANYMIKVTQVSHSAAKVGLKLEHSPDGNFSCTHSTPIATAAPPSMPGVLSGDSTSTIMIGLAMSLLTRVW
jgi:hypothetical protein